MNLGDLLPNLTTWLTSTTAQAADIVDWAMPATNWLGSWFVAALIIILPIIAVTFIIRKFTHHN